VLPGTDSRLLGTHVREARQRRTPHVGAAIVPGITEPPWTHTFSSTGSVIEATTEIRIMPRQPRPPPSGRTSQRPMRPTGQRSGEAVLMSASTELGVVSTDMSPSETMPIAFPRSTTGRRRTLRARIS
jgi:hypothetical protein